MEGLAISPDGKTPFGAMQSPLIQGGGTNGPYTRILKLDLVTGATAQYVYPLTNIGSVSKPKYPTISEIAVFAYRRREAEIDDQGPGERRSIWHHGRRWRRGRRHGIQARLAAVSAEPPLIQPPQASCPPTAILDAESGPPDITMQ
jgi:hypothetical protein